MRYFITTLLFLTLSLSIIQAQVNINPCAQFTPIHIVVIGSSTAAGTGPSTPDSAWVNRYRNYLQTINPQNQVTNLAIGGTTTYHIMPSWYLAPSNRPSTNSSNNVTQAINLGADLIIVNMPSNDASNGFGINEQMSNFIAIYNHADSVGIPVLVATTQPKTPFGATGDAIQLGVRDSIFSYFGNNAIDFWTGIAAANNDILAQYDSGDGTHLNDAAHAILVSRVIDKEVPNLLADTVAYTDHVLFSLTSDSVSICGDSSTTIQAVVANIGTTSLGNISIDFLVTDQLLFSNNFTNFNIMSMAACSADTFDIQLNTFNTSHYTIQANLQSGDTDLTNDTSQVLSIMTSGHPSLQTWNDTVCLGDSALLYAQSDLASDAILWYDMPIGGNLVEINDSYTVTSILTNQNYYPQAVRGNLYYNASLATSTTTTTNWNGFMFDLLAKDSIILDSISCKLFTTGAQNIIVYKRDGSHIGHENTAADWTFWTNLSIQVNASGDFIYLDLPDTVLNNGDTLGIYLHLQDGAGQLSYLNSGSTINYENTELQILGGTGISHTFGTTYSPRNFCGEIFYHYGFNPLGDCATDRKTASIVVSEPTIDLGNDTTLVNDESIVLSPSPNGFLSYLWSTGASNSSIMIDSSDLGIGTHAISVLATDVYGCEATDTILISFELHTSNILIENSLNFKISPNPSSSWLKIHLDFLPKPTDQFYITDATGKQVRQFAAQQEQVIYIGDLPKGVYWISLETDQRLFTKAIRVK